MTESYAVEASLIWKTNVPEVLLNMQRAFEEIDRLIGSTKDNLGAFAAELKELSSGSRGIGAMSRAFERIKVNPEALAGLREMRDLTRQLAEAQSDLRA